MWHCWTGLFLWTHLNWTDQRKDMAPWPAVIPPVTSPVVFLSIPGTTGSQEQFLTSSHAVPLPAVHSPCHYSWPAPVYSFSLSLAVTFSSKSSLSFSAELGATHLRPLSSHGHFTCHIIASWLLKQWIPWRYQGFLRAETGSYMFLSVLPEPLPWSLTHRCSIIFTECTNEDDCLLSCNRNWLSHSIMRKHWGSKYI